MKKLSYYCAKGSKAKVEMVPINTNVKLKVTSFTSAAKNNNPKIIFVAGWVSLMIGWQKVLKEMTKEYDVYYVETREKNTSQVKGKVNFGINELSNDLKEIVSKLEFKDGEYILFGSSLGGTTILDCCMTLPVKPLSLILIGPNAYFRIPRFGKVLIKSFYPPLYLWFKPYVKWYLKNFRLDVKSDPAQYEKYCGALDAADPWKLKNAAIAFFYYSVWDKLSKIDIPTLVIGASKDELHEPENLKKIVDKMKTATYLDMETNEKTHSEEVVGKMKDYLIQLKVMAAKRNRKK
ncbi:alpha/beta fold hydrolase [Bacteroidota bacterium]